MDTLFDTSPELGEVEMMHWLHGGPGGRSHPTEMDIRILEHLQSQGYVKYTAKGNWVDYNPTKKGITCGLQL